MGIIKARNLKYEYFKYDDNGQTQESQTAVDSVNLDIREGHTMVQESLHWQST